MEERSSQWKHAKFESLVGNTNVSLGTNNILPIFVPWSKELLELVKLSFEPILVVVQKICLKTTSCVWEKMWKQGYILRSIRDFEDEVFFPNFHHARSIIKGKLIAPTIGLWSILDSLLF